MTTRVPFHWYVGDRLASLLPYRKKKLLFGPEVCEWPAVLPMTTGACFIGCALALCDNSVAEEILTEAATNPKGYGLEMKPQSWRIAFSKHVQDLERRNQYVDVATATFESFFPEVTPDKWKDVVLTPEECVTSIGQRVLMGLMLGVLLPKTALSMLKAWSTQPSKGWKALGVGGLQVDSTPLLASVEEAYSQAQSIYQAWQQSG